MPAVTIIMLQDILQCVLQSAVTPGLALSKEEVGRQYALLEVGLYDV